MSTPVPAVCELILDQIPDAVRIAGLGLGPAWTWCRTADAVGLAPSPGAPPPGLPGSLAGRPAADIAALLRSPDAVEASLGLAAANAAINAPGNALMARAVPVPVAAQAHLAVFAHLRPRLAGRTVVVVGRFPGLAALFAGLDATLPEGGGGDGRLPDPAAERLIPRADWVFLTAASLVDRTFERLAELARDAVTELVGPGVPWLGGLADHGVDLLAGVVPAVDADRAAAIAARDDGSRLFGEGVRWAVADIGTGAMEALKREIAETARRRAELTAAMAAWYDSGNRRRFPRHAELETVTAALSALDTRYKRQWDARRRVA